jgi:radical SAM superfamily enzyme YgiQ (UPF0313 family)
MYPYFEKGVHTLRVALVNANRISPPIAPIGLEYVAEVLYASGHTVDILDLCWEEQPETAIAGFFGRREFGLVGISIRNTDDCSLSSRESFLPGHASLADCIRRHSGAPIVLGGVGFSVMPEAVLTRCGVDIGIRGDGDFIFPRLAGRLEEGREWDDLPNLVALRKGKWQRNPASFPSLDALPPMTRRWIDNGRYFREGGQAGIETKRGCPHRCVYCADPIAKGKTARLRPPGAVADELERLLSQGIDHIHTCDSEFNAPESHANDVCDEIIRRGLGENLRWYAYCTPGAFSPDLAGKMRRAGCQGINFGVDSGDEGMLRRLGRNFGPADILDTARACRQAGITVMFDLLLGSPGESRESVVRTIELVRQAKPDRAGIAVGVRLYPGTEIARIVSEGERENGRIGGEDLSDPVFFLEPDVAPFLFDLLDDLTRDDSRFLFFDPSRPASNYNYNANKVLADAIGNGFRGAYWDILRRCGGTKEM